MHILAPAITGALLVSAVPTYLAGVNEYPHALATRARGDKAALVTCMDPRINVDFLLKQLNLTSSNSYIVRNAGGRAKEALRSVVVSQEFLGTSEVHVIHHTECGMAAQSEESMRQRFYKADDKYRAVLVNDMEFLPIRTKNYTESVLNDVSFLEAHPLNKATKITGWVYTIAKNGKDSVTQVYPATGAVPPSETDPVPTSNAYSGPPSSTDPVSTSSAHPDPTSNVYRGPSRTADSASSTVTSASSSTTTSAIASGPAYDD